MMGDTLQANSDVVRDDLCFCCGKDNDRGLKLGFSYPDKGIAETTLTIPEWFSGWRRMTHGGLLSMLLDECMAHACISLHGNAITAELTVRFHTPVEVGAEVTVHARASLARSRIIDTEGTINGHSGKKIASAKARFLAAPAES
jgi:acyl-coenzyme A thioesterase PaaI-like protein